MPIQVIDNFEVRVQKAIDNRFVVGPTQYYTDKNDIEYKYTGLRVWDLTLGSPGVPYVWDGTTWQTEASSGISGSGTPGYIPKFIGSGGVIADSVIRESSSNIGIGVSPTEKLDVNGNVKATKFLGLAWDSGSGLININLGTNGSNVTGTIGVVNLKNGTTQGRILISGASSPTWDNQLQIGTAPASSSPGNGLYFRNTITSRLYGVLGSGLRFTIGSTNTLDIVEGQIRTTNGSAASPAISFISDPNTGIYRVGNEQIGFSTNGSNRLTISTSAITSTLPFRAESGSESIPSYSFSSNTGTGMWYSQETLLFSTTRNLRFSLNGSEVLRINDAGLTLIKTNSLRLQDGSEGVPALSFENDPNTGIYRYGTDSLGFTLGSKLRFRMRLGGATDFEFWNHNGTGGLNGKLINYGTHAILDWSNGIRIENYLYVDGGIAWTGPSGTWTWFSGSQTGTYDTDVWSPTRSTSIQTTGDIHAGGLFVAGSDIRIKDIIGVENSSDSLEKIKNIEITRYTYKDKIRKGNKEQTKLIAQQIKDILPESVIESSDFIPNIYNVYKIYKKEEDIYTIEIDEKITDIEKLDEVKVYNSKSKELNVIIESVSENSISFRYNGNETIGVDDEIFIYGKKINDYLSVDYDNVMCINISATQELIKIVENQQNIINDLQSKLSNLEK